MAGTLEIEEAEQDGRREEDLFFERIDAQSAKLYSIAYSYLRSDADALEMLQEASYRAWSKRRTLKEEAFFDSWFIRILINCCMDEFRRRKKVIPTERVGEHGNAPVTAEMRSSDQTNLEAALEALPEKYRHVLILRFYHDMTLAEIARILGKPEGTVKSRLYRALKQMRGKLDHRR